MTGSQPLQALTVFSPSGSSYHELFSPFGILVYVYTPSSLWFVLIPLRVLQINNIFHSYKYHK